MWSLEPFDTNKFLLGKYFRKKTRSALFNQIFIEYTRHPVTRRQNKCKMPQWDATVWVCLKGFIRYKILKSPS